MNKQGSTAADTDPDVLRKVLLAYIEANGPLRGCELTGSCMGVKSRLIWLQRAGYVAREQPTGRPLWNITVAGRRWIAHVDGAPTLPRTIARSGRLIESPDVRWPDVRGGAGRLKHGSLS